MEERDAKILRHVGRYRLTLRVVLDHLFFDPSSSGCGNVITRLLRNRLLRARDGLPQKRVYYQLTERGTASVGVPATRAEPIGAQAFREALAVLWHCHLAELPDGVAKRTRLEPSELEELFGRPVGSGPQPHVLEHRSGDHCLFRVTAPSPSTKTANILRGARHWHSRAVAVPEFEPWLRAGKYAFLVLVERERVSEIRRAAKRADLSPSVIVSPVPGINIERDLHDRRVPEGSE